MLKKVLVWTGIAFAGIFAGAGLQSMLEGHAPLFKNEVAAEENFAGLAKSEWYYRGSVIASDPSIVKTNDGYVMFYTDLDAGKGRTVIAKASSPDGQDWKTSGSFDGVNGVVMAGRSGQWDENVESAAVVRQDDRWLLYFSGYRDNGNPTRGFPAALWLATSNDGGAFERLSSDPIMTPTKGWYDNDAIYSPTVLLDDGVFHMVYVGHSYTDFSAIGAGGVYLLSATSTDGVNWTKGEKPIAAPGQFNDWRKDGIAEPYLVKRGADEYLLFYTGLSGEEREIGVATGSSPEGPWEFGSGPIVKRGPSGSPDEHQVLAPAALVENGRLRLWYLAANKSEALSIGQADGSLNEALSASGH